ncbi:hypothetical protein A1O3_08663 [Capronia epimyces CBS 606.96]|uniref:Phosphatidylinositol-specific phospholipase C X domain-containing protein n=1 Tax=Capronia epimyces CBS 606.96 TaxID=1182542 RepID=W9XF71_9EURO|nr:uncharacterized protein A1O3_08663 [Capronia epimyces CBS 606.96]EXJ79162.1 hypothetical protein A1O3_08663 [Capronia epimyces CBS 606.96]
MATYTNLSLVNYTPYTWSEIGLSGTYGVPEWDFPKTLESGQTYDAQIIIDETTMTSPSQTQAQWPFTWIDNTHPVANLKISVSGNSDDGYTSVIKAELDAFGISNNAKGSTIEIPLQNEQWSPFILVGDQNSLAGNHPPTNWMAQNLPYIGCLTLQDLVLPGSHDAGMSTIKYPAGGDSDNTQTQSLDIYGQLQAGVRYFDIRPTISHGAYYTGHYTGDLGANGQEMSAIVADINQFTSEGNNELIILELSHSSDTDDKYQAFDDGQYNDLLFELWNNTQHLYTGHKSDVLTTVPLTDFISKGPAVVVICDERNSSWLQNHRFQGRGFYSSDQVPIYNSYSDTTDLDTMRKDQYTKLVAQAKSPDRADQLFLLSWTGTQNIIDVIGLGSSIQGLASLFNGHLAQVGSNVPYTGPISWAEKVKPPNIILIDYVSTDRFLTSITVGLTRFYNSKCS